MNTHTRTHTHTHTHTNTHTHVHTAHAYAINMSGIGIVKAVKPDEHSGQYCAQVYYTKKDFYKNWYYCHFVVTKELYREVSIHKEHNKPCL